MKAGKTSPAFLFFHPNTIVMLRFANTLLLLFACMMLMGYAQAQELVILHTNDTHSQIEPYTHKADTNVGGFLRREAFVREVRSKHPNVLLLDAGDHSQGTPYFNFFKGYTEVKLMNAMAYDAVTLGNHEFDNGSAALAKRLKKATFAVVCANYVFHDKHLAKQVKPYVILEKAGKRIGIFGLVVDLHSLVAPNVADELSYQDPVAAAQKTVDELQQQKCDLIVCLSHLGVDESRVNDFTIAKEVPGIDIIIGGHSHKELDPPVQIGNTRIFQLANRGKGVGEITITF